jgi:hypothetical protein
MPEFVIGDEFCCQTKLDVQLFEDPDWRSIPHITEWSKSGEFTFSTTVTSSTNGIAKSGCGSSDRTGTLTWVCHNGTQPNFCLGREYRLRCIIDTDDPTTYIESTVTITSDAISVDANAGDPPTYVFNVHFEDDYTENGNMPGAGC